MFEEADKYLYYGKHNGKNVVVSEYNAEIYAGTEGLEGKL